MQYKNKAKSTNSLFTSTFIKKLVGSKLTQKINVHFPLL